MYLAYIKSTEAVSQRASVFYIIHRSVNMREFFILRFIRCEVSGNEMQKNTRRKIAMAVTSREIPPPPYTSTIIPLPSFTTLTTLFLLCACAVPRKFDTSGFRGLRAA